MTEEIPIAGLLLKKLMGGLAMMQAQNHNHDGDDEDRTKWYEISASVGHLVLAVLLAIIGGGSVVFSYIWDNHKAITLLQERQAFALKYIADDTAAMTEHDRRLAQQLAAISHQVEELKIEIVRHMAATGYVDSANGNKRRQ
jgi:hypothetical protein